jgi:hypothetical protein
MAENGKLLASELAPIRPYGELANDAAAAWNAPHGPADNGLCPTGPELSTYRTFAGQLKTWAAYLAGGALAARPGFSVHGLGKAVDLAEMWMRSWIDDHGKEFGWAKTEAFSEWWHVNFIGGVSFATFKTLRHGMRGKRVVKFSRRLRFIHRQGVSHGYLHRSFWKYKDAVIDAVKKFQRDHDLTDDGVIGPKTARQINATFHRQYVERKGKRKRLLRDVVRGRK